MAVPSSSTIPLKLSGSPTPPEPCHVCLDLNLGKGSQQNYWYETRDATYKGVVAGAEAGCRGCKVLQFAVRPKFEEWGTHSIELIIMQRRHETSVWVGTNSHFHNSRATRIELYKLLGQDGAKSRWPHCLSSKTPISGHTGSEEAMNTARLWIATCLSDHKAMCSIDQPTTLPTRVLRIDGPEKVALHISGGEYASYVCLSHCWGDKTISLLRTTTATLEQFQSGIPWEVLPKTFREAIHVTQQLGLQYLWIDSLCIIQDSEEDWRHEGSMMADIYELAHVTLAATKPPNADSGLFSDSRASHLSRQMKLDSIDMRMENAVDTVHFREKLPHNLSGGPLHPLLSRGWAFQERLLARRILHFTGQEIGFECKACHRCECSPAGRSPLVFGLVRQRDRHDREDYWDEHIWKEVVSAYTTKSFTYTTDISPALQGLAKKFEKRMGRYYAGYWEKSLLYSLVWCRCGDLRARPQSQENWRAPTWSWASIDGKVFFSHLGSQSPQALVTVLNVKTTPVGEDPMGQISSGTLVLAGRCLHATLEAEWETEVVLERYCIQSLHRPDSKAGRFYLRQSTFGQDSVFKGLHFDYDLGIAGAYHIPTGSKLLLMKMFEWGHEFDQMHQYWLVFREAESDKHICERVGKLELDKEDEAKYMMDQAFEEDAVEMEITIV